MTKESENTKRPEILVDIYGTKPVPAATFGKGVRDIAGIEQATHAQKNAVPGAYSQGGSDQTKAVQKTLRTTLDSSDRGA
jgi:hypothetical protein